MDTSSHYCPLGGGHNQAEVEWLSVRFFSP